MAPLLDAVARSRIARLVLEDGSPEENVDHALLYEAAGRRALVDLLTDGNLTELSLDARLDRENAPPGGRMRSSLNQPGRKIATTGHRNAQLGGGLRPGIFDYSRKR
jgi:hypothetical protein